MFDMFIYVFIIIVSLKYMPLFFITNNIFFLNWTIFLILW